ncbi:MAG TPA: lipoyl synthase [Candidatus Omnitrophota bacterium]|nr:lipoyl synthase [Candidatus Omnitrophota bacterium]
MPHLVDDNATHRLSPLPAWFRQELPDMDTIRRMKEMFRASGLHTVCESARCPNIGTCWGRGVATFMILGDICTRGCRFCAVRSGRPLEVEAGEPRQVALAVELLNLRYVVITSVARDDLEDEGAGQFCQTIREIRQLTPQTKIEVLIPDFSNKIESLRKLVEAQPEVVSHNIETVQRLSLKVRPQAGYERSLEVLRNFKGLDPALLTKSSLMVGLGESRDEITQVMKDLRENDCDILTIGQYLQPTKFKRHLPVDKYYAPGEFDALRQEGLSMGFKHVMSGPLVRSSYIAEEGYQECMAHSKRDPACP